jgi:phosphate transport system permease protein
MILPTIALLVDSALGSVPLSYSQAATALGLSRTTLLLQITLPVAKPGIYTALLLAIGRAIGETMAVLMVAGNVVQIPHGVLEPIRTLTANIALEMAYAMGEHRAALFFSGLVLLFIVSVLVITAQRLAKTHAAV